MLLSPTLTLLSIVFNFCALLHVTNSRNGISPRWPALDRAIYALEETTVTAYSNYLDIVAPLPLTSSPVYSPTLRRAEWVYRSSAVRLLDLVDGSGKIQTAPDVASPPSSPLPLPSPIKPTDPITSTSLPTLTSLTYPATFEPFPTYDPSTPSVATSPVAQSSGLTWVAFCLVFASMFTWLKNRHFRQTVPGPKPTLTCDTDCQIPVDDFHSIYTVTPLPSDAGSEVDFAESRSEIPSNPSCGSHIDHHTKSRTFPVVITSSEGKALFNAEIKLSSNRVVTSLSATTSTVSFSIDVVASLDVSTVSEWYMPGKDDGDVPAHAEDSVFLLLVRGYSDRSPFSEDFQDPDHTLEPEDTLFVDQTPQSDGQTSVSDCEVGDTGACDIPPLGSPMCPVTIPIHYRGFSSFETALINSGTKMRREDAHRGNYSRRNKARTNIRPSDVRFAWLKDLYTCGNGHLDGCPCEETKAGDVLSEQYPPPQPMSEVFYDHNATLDFNRDPHSEERGPGMRQWAYTVSPGLSVRSEMPPTSIFDSAEPRLAARSDPLLANGEEPAGLDSTVALMPSFSVVSPELSPRCRSSGISTSAEFSDRDVGEQSVSSEEDDMETGSTGEFTPTNRFASDTRSPPSPIVSAQVDSLLSALEPILADYTSPPSPEEATLVHPSSALNDLEDSPLHYSPSNAVPNPANCLAVPECDDWVGDSTGTIESVYSDGFGG